ncbi:MAG TPA: ATP-binding protein, partial [Candidatus Sulfotelmatobacter sp.]|nr:ATP-binding protein [Candidatus Sulfotelmatobacter sp.]
ANARLMTLEMLALVEQRCATLNALVARLELELIEASSRRMELRSRLRENEEKRRELLEELARHRRDLIEKAFEEGIELCAELGAVEERVIATGQRIERVCADRDAMRELIAELQPVNGARGPRSYQERYSRAIQQLYQLIADSHAAITEEILEGPMQQLANVAVAAEVVERELFSQRRDLPAHVARCSESIRAAFRDLRRILFDLHPPELEDEGLAAVLRHSVRRLPQPIVGRFHLTGDDRRLPVPAALAIFRITREALHNAERHARPRRVDVTLAVHSDRATVLIKDDGEGFDLAAVQGRLGRTRALGLIMMNEYAQLEGGRFEISSMIGSGTEVRAFFDLNAADERTGHGSDDSADQATSRPPGGRASSRTGVRPS